MRVKWPGQSARGNNISDRERDVGPSWKATSPSGGHRRAGGGMRTDAGTGREVGAADGARTTRLITIGANR